MSRFKLLLAIAFSLSLYNIYSYENQIWDNWYFGRRAAITFNTPNRMPVALNNSQINTLEGCASISDTNGNLLFYTNGVDVYNRFGEVMPNGTNLKGHYSSTQSALIVKRPKSNNLYQIFTVDKGPYEGDSPHELCVSLVDMSLDNGKGDVVFKNYTLHSPVVEKLTAIQHANGEDFWIFARGMNDNKFIVSLLTAGGVVSTNTFEIGPTYFPFPASPEFALGQLKANPKGDMLATVVYGANNIELYKFDNASGSIIDYIGIPVLEPVTALYGVEFSSNNKYLYVNNLYGRIYQYDVSTFDKDKIFNSMNIVFDSLDYNFQKFGQLQLGPNGRIYMALSYDTLLAAIRKPNVPHPYCQYSPRDVGLNGRLSLFGLPNNVITGIYYSVDVYGKSICTGIGDSVELFSTVYPDDVEYTYEWKGPNGFNSNLPNPKILNANFNATGMYKCNVSLDGKLFKSDSVYIDVFEIPKAEITGPKSICPPEKVKLSSKYQSPEYIYKWSDGSSGPDLLISAPGVYKLYVTNPAGCLDSVIHEVVNDDNLNITFDGKPVICKGSTARIALDKDVYEPITDYRFRWSNGANTISTVATRPGWYVVTVIRNGGCSGTDSIFVEEIEPTQVTLNLSDTVGACKGDSIMLEAIDYNPLWNYKWNDGFAGFRRYVTQSGKYTLIVDNKGFCESSVDIYVQFEDLIQPELEFDNSMQLCFGDTLNVTIKNFNDDYSYNWSNGSSEKSISLTETGKLTLLYQNAIGCKDSLEFNLFVAPELNLNILADKTYLCLNDSVTLSANARYSSYKWSTGDTTDFIRVHEPGDYTLIAENSIGCKDTSNITISGLNFTAIPSKNSIIMDSVCIGNSVSEIIEVIYNTNQDLIISDVTWLGNVLDYSLDFEVEKTSPTEFIQKIEFIPGSNLPGIYEGEILINIEKPCSNQISIPVYIKIYSEYNFSVNQIDAVAGDKRCINVEISSNCGINPHDKLFAPKFGIKFISEYFWPDTVIGGKIIEINNDNIFKIITLELDSNSFPPNTKRKLEICGTVLAGQKEVSDVLIENIDWGNTFTYNNITNGSIKVEACTQETRRLQVFKPASVSIAPNPVSDNLQIKIFSQQRGNHILSIYNLEGILVFESNLGEFSIDNNRILNIETEAFNQGFYHIILRAPWSVITEKMYIIKN